MTFTHIESRLLSCAAQAPAPSPSHSPAPKQVSPHAPVCCLILLLLLISFPWQCQGRVSCSPNCSQAEPESFTVAQQHLSAQGRGTSLSHCAAVRSLHGSSGQSLSPAGRRWAPQPHGGSILVIVQQEDRTLPERDTALHSQESRQDAALHTGQDTGCSSVGAAISSTCVPHWKQPNGARVEMQQKPG